MESRIYTSNHPQYGLELMDVPDISLNADLGHIHLHLEKPVYSPVFPENETGLLMQPARPFIEAIEGLEAVILKEFRSDLHRLDGFIIHQSLDCISTIVDGLILFRIRRSGGLLDADKAKHGLVISHNVTEREKSRIHSCSS